MRRLLTAASWLGAGVALGAAAVGQHTAGYLNAPRRPWPDYGFTPFEVGVPAEDISFTAADGVRLAGWWLDQPPRPHDVVVICAHGHRGGKADLLGIGPGLWRAGHSVLLFDFRGCGASGDGPQSLAHHEQRDLAAAIDVVAARRPGARIAVVGFSMGASTAILTAATDNRVDLLVLDSPFATMSEVVASAYRRHRLPPRMLLPIADLVTRARYGYWFGQVRPVDVIAALAPRPILLLHGEADRIIPVEHARALAAAAGPGLDLVTFAGADHCGGYFLDRPGYIARVAGFLANHTTPTG